MAKINHKILQRAISKALVNDTGDVIKLVQKYNPAITKNISYADLLLAVMDLMETNPQFSQEFAKLLLKKRRLINYNNADGDKEETKQVGVGLWSSIVSGASNIIGSTVGKIGVKQQNAVEQSKVNAANTQQIMGFMMQDEQAREAEKNRTAIMIYIAIGSMVLITGLIIYLKKAKP